MNLCLDYLKRKKEILIAKVFKFYVNILLNLLENCFDNENLLDGLNRFNLPKYNIKKLNTL